MHSGEYLLQLWLTGRVIELPLTYILKHLSFKSVKLNQNIMLMEKMLTQWKGIWWNGRSNKILILLIQQHSLELKRKQTKRNSNFNVHNELSCDLHFRKIMWKLKNIFFQKISEKNERCCVEEPETNNQLLEKSSLWLTVSGAVGIIKMSSAIIFIRGKFQQEFRRCRQN